MTRAENQGGPVRPEDAATVLLLRESAGGLEVYLTRRQDALIFLGGYHVFPGGKVDRQDRSPAQLELCRGLRREPAEFLPGAPALAATAGFYVAAVRELFEETGVLLAEDGEGRPVESLATAAAARLAAARLELQAGNLSFADLLRAERLFCPLGRLHWFARWITPATSPRRFNTYFFLAALPSGQAPSPFFSEIAEAVWARPAEALDRWRRGQWRMIPPTIASLDTLGRFGSVAELAAAYGRPPADYPRVSWP